MTLVVGTSRVFYRGYARTFSATANRESSRRFPTTSSDTKTTAYKVLAIAFSLVGENAGKITTAESRARTIALRDVREY